MTEAVGPTSVSPPLFAPLEKLTEAVAAKDCIRTTVYRLGRRRDHEPVSDLSCKTRVEIAVTHLVVVD